jgi:hypothetical protein
MDVEDRLPAAPEPVRPHPVPERARAARRLRIVVTGFEPFWNEVLRGGLSKRYADELEVSSMPWPTTAADRLMFLRAMLRTDIVVRVGMPFEFDSETNRLWLTLVRTWPHLSAVNYWIGTDVLRFRDRLRDKGLSARDERAIGSMRHLAASDNLADDLAALGVPAEGVTFPSPEREMPDLLPRFPDHFSVLAYWMDGRAEHCGAPEVLEAARRMPDVRFDVVGTTGEGLDVPSNVRFHGNVSDMERRYADATVLLRPIAHDAVPAGMVEEALAFGRYVVYSHDYPHCMRIDYRDTDGIVAALEALRERRRAGELPLNLPGHEFVVKDWEPDARFAVVHDALLARDAPGGATTSG